MVVEIEEGRGLSVGFDDKGKGRDPGERPLQRRHGDDEKDSVRKEVRNSVSILNFADGLLVYGWITRWIAVDLMQSLPVSPSLLPY